MDPSPAPLPENDPLLSQLYSDDEKAQILGQIEQAASANRFTVDADAFRPRKRGILLPILVNLIAVGLVVGAWFTADALFQLRQQTLKLKTDQLFSTESKLLTKVLEDSKAQLAEKNAEIEKIQGDLTRLAAEKATLQRSFSDRVAARERELRQELATALAEERKRLIASGVVDPTELARRLKQFETEKNLEFNTRLDSYRRLVQTEIDERTQAVTALQARLQSTVTEQDRLRREIERQTKERERELQSQLSTQTADLERLRNEREDLNAYFRQADAAMVEVRSAFDSGDWSRTQTALLGLRQILARATASTSEVVRTRAKAEAAIVASLDAAVAAMSSSTSSAKTESSGQIDAIRAQAKKEQALAALQLSEIQKSLTEANEKWRQAEEAAEVLRTDLQRALAEGQATRDASDTTRSEVDSLTAQVASLQQTIDELTPYRTRLEALQLLFETPYATAKDRFIATFSSEAGALVFPRFEGAWTDLERQFLQESTAGAVRTRTLNDVLAFTSYLRGVSPTAQSARDTTERLARTDAEYKAVVDSIQALVGSGAAETTINTATTQLYGAVSAVSGSRVILEPMTKVRPQTGQIIELRRSQGRKETVLGRGSVLSATDRRVELEWIDKPAPLSGDAAYLVLP